MVSFKNRWKIIQEEMIDKKGKRIYVERKIKEIIKDRYAHGEINLNSSYIYEKMGKLVKQRIYVPIWNIGCYAHEVGLVNVFELHKRLESIIKIHHLHQKHKTIYTQKDKLYMEEFIKSRKYIDDRFL